MIIVANYVWLICGLLEYLNFIDLSNFVTSRTSEDRGVSSLATEPTFFAMQLFLFSYTVVAFRNYKLRVSECILLFLNFLAVLFIAKSTMGLLYDFGVLVFFTLFWFSKRPFLALFTLILTTMMIFLIGTIQQNDDIRIYQVLNTLFQGGIFNLFYSDASINGRIQDIIVPGYYFIMNFGMPGGFSNYGVMESEYVKSLFKGYFWYQVGGDIIMSYVMSMLVELGIFGILSYLALTYKKQRLNYKRILEKITLVVILLSAVPIANALPVYIMIANIFNDDRNG